MSEALNGKVSTSALAGHTGNTSNPHNVTKAQVGLGNVDNTSDLNKPISTATQTALNGKASTSALAGHTGNTSNPHSVTKAQVGLGNVNNTSDASKPISTATQTALDGTVKTTGHQTINNGYLTLSGLTSPRINLVLNDNKLAVKGNGSGRIAFLDEENKPISEMSSYIHSTILSSSTTLNAYTKDATGSEIHAALSLTAIPNGDTYGTIPMRSSPGSLDIVNVNYVLNQVTGMVNYVQGEMSKMSADLTERITADLTEKITAEVTAKLTADMMSKIESPDNPTIAKFPRVGYRSDEL